MRTPGTHRALVATIDVAALRCHTAQDLGLLQRLPARMWPSNGLFGMEQQPTKKLYRLGTATETFTPNSQGNAGHGNSGAGRCVA